MLTETFRPQKHLKAGKDPDGFVAASGRTVTCVAPLQVSLLLPGCSSAPADLDQVLGGFSTFYLLRDLPVHELLDSRFLQEAVLQGKLHPRPSSTLSPAAHLFTCTCVSDRKRVRPVSPHQDR